MAIELATDAPNGGIGEHPMTDTQSFLESFQAVLHRLASPREEQAQYVTDLGLADSLDELALEFDDLYRPLELALLSLPNGPEVVGVCQAIDAALMSGSLGWRIDDLGSAEWASVRTLASRAHELLSRALGWDAL